MPQALTEVVVESDYGASIKVEITGSTFWSHSLRYTFSYVEKAGYNSMREFDEDASANLLERVFDDQFTKATVDQIADPKKATLYFLKPRSFTEWQVRFSGRSVGDFNSAVGTQVRAIRPTLVNDRAMWGWDITVGTRSALNRLLEHLGGETRYTSWPQGYYDAVDFLAAQGRGELLYPVGLPYLLHQSIVHVRGEMLAAGDATQALLRRGGALVLSGLDADQSSQDSVEARRAAGYCLRTWDDGTDRLGRPWHPERARDDGAALVANWGTALGTFDDSRADDWAERVRLCKEAEEEIGARADQLESASAAVLLEKDRWAEGETLGSPVFVTDS